MMPRVLILAAVIHALIFGSSAEFTDEFVVISSYIIHQQLQNLEKEGLVKRPTKLSDLKGPHWWNESHVGVVLDCDEAAKDCLAIQRIVFESTGKCYELGSSEPCGRGGELVLDQDDFHKGKLRSECQFVRHCTENEIPMGSDFTCRDVVDIFVDLCPFSKTIVYHPFGEIRCAYPSALYSDPVSFAQPRSPRRCILPSLRGKSLAPFVVKCNSKEAFCLENGKLPFQDSCYAALSRVPCPEGQWLVLDLNEAQKNRLRVSCRSAQPCGPGSHLLHEDGTCHSEEELRGWLCPGDYIMHHVNGNAFCKSNNKIPEIVGNEVENGMCHLQIRHC